LRDKGTVFEILEKCGHRHTGAAKYPRSAHTFRVSLNGRARGPIDHGENSSTFAL
jgi:hypothetical protein